ncbi:FecR domain-containing protein [Pseudomonas caspiana]|uniref:FecR domain-containing protein n=1 Tax=Pseudomonas caspiana TaxID=1451454 RepID=UPI0032EFFBEC
MVVLDHKTLEAAATWYVQLNSSKPNAAQRQAWSDWVAASPAHAQAWARVERLQSQFSSLPQEVALPTLVGVRARRRAVLKTLALLLATGTAGWTLKDSTAVQGALAQYHTSKGQRRELRLSDGSTLNMNTDSAVDISYDPGLRLIRLRRGEILIQTASDPANRPFVVHTSEGQVRALGTRFSVRSDGSTSEVSVMEHAVEVRASSNPSVPFRLEAGQRVGFTRDKITTPMPVPPGADAWTQGMLTVIEWRLGDFITELSRYRHGFVRCADSIADLRLSGAFRVDDTDTILENLGVSLPVKVKYLTRYWVSIEAV